MTQSSYFHVMFEATPACKWFGRWFENVACCLVSLSVVISNANYKCCKKTTTRKNPKKKNTIHKPNCVQIEPINMQDVRHMTLLQNVAILKDLDLEHLENRLSSSLVNSIKISVGLCI